MHVLYWGVNVPVMSRSLACAGVTCDGFPQDVCTTCRSRAERCHDPAQLPGSSPDRGQYQRAGVRVGPQATLPDSSRSSPQLRLLMLRHLLRVESQYLAADHQGPQQAYQGLHGRGKRRQQALPLP